MLYIINLQILLVLALYDNPVISPIGYDIIFGIAAFHFTLIALYHTITYSCKGKIKTKIHSGITKLLGWITRYDLHSSSHNRQQFFNELKPHNTRNEIPEAVNYHQYQETLLNEQY